MTARDNIDGLIAALVSTTSLSEREIRHLIDNLPVVGVALVPLRATARIADQIAGLTSLCGGPYGTPQEEWESILDVSPYRMDREKGCHE